MLKWNCPSCGKENNEDGVSILDDGTYVFDCLHCLCVFSGYMNSFVPQGFEKSKDPDFIVFKIKTEDEEEFARCQKKKAVEAGRLANEARNRGNLGA